MNDSKENLTTGGFSGTPQNAGRSGHRVENTALLIMVALCLLFIGLSMTVFKGTDFRADLDYLMAIQISESSATRHSINSFSLLRISAPASCAV